MAKPVRYGCRYSVYFDPEVADALEAYAEKNEVTPGQALRMIVTVYFKLLRKSWKGADE